MRPDGNLLTTDHQSTFLKQQPSPIKSSSVGDQMPPVNDPFALQWQCLRYTAFSSRSDCVVDDPCWSICDAHDPITIRLPCVGCNLINACGVRVRLSIYNDRRTALSELKRRLKNFDFDFLISVFHNMVRHRTNTTVMHVKRRFSNCLHFVKTHY